MTAEQFTTLVLRALYYNDSEGDFVWNKSLNKALEIGILNADSYNYFTNKNTFTRGDMSYILYSGMNIPIKDAKDNYMTLMRIYKDIKDPFNTKVTISELDESLIPKELRGAVYRLVEGIYGRLIRAKELTISNVKYKEDGRWDLKFELKVVYDNEDGIKNEVNGTVNMSGDIFEDYSVVEEDDIIENMIIEDDISIKLYDIIDNML